MQSIPCRSFPLIPACLIWAVLALAMPLALAAAASGAPSNAADNPARPLRVALLLEHGGPASAGDSWTTLLNAGLDRAARDFSLHAETLAAAPGTDQEAVFRRAARDFDLVLVASDGFHTILRENAANFRNTLFGCIDAGIRAPNIMCVTFADEQAAFLAGAAAAMLTGQTGLPGINREKIIGWLSGEDVPAMRSLLNGFSEGARLIDPQVRVINTVTGSFGDAAAGREKARGLLEQGADVLVLAAGRGNAGALEEVRKRNAYAVGLDADQRALLPGRMLTSILKGADRAVYEIVAAAAANGFRGKEIIVYDLKNGGVEISDMAPFKAVAGENAPPDLERRLKELRGEILNGSIRLKSLRARTLCDCR